MDQQLLSVVPYRCVCGNAIALTSDKLRDCLRCGRSVPDTAYSLTEATVVGDGPQTFAPVPASADPLLNRQLKHFRIQTRLGHGGMGAVYRAIDESLQRYVALKVLKRAAGQTDDANSVSRLLQEARAQARVCHPNVVQVYYVDHEDDHPFLAMELVRGETLRDRIRRRKLSFAEVVEIAIQTTQALEAASQYRIVHGDIKPANLMITPEGTVKLSDFGLARTIEDLWHGSQVVAGTPNYLSPEGCQGLATNFRSDMYSLGVMFFEMTFGRLPYEMPSDSVTAVLKAHIESPVCFPAGWPEEVPAAWRGVLEKLLAKNPQARFDNYSQLLAELRRLAPVSLPRAGRFVRGASWLAELAPGLAAVQWAESVRTGSASTGQALTGFALASGLLAMLSVWTSVCGWSLGKSLFHTRDVDEFGQTARGSQVLWRSLIQQSPLWAAVIWRVLGLWGLPLAGAGVAAVIVGAVLLDVAVALCRKDGRALHDLWLKTHVVLDTSRQVRVGPEETVEPPPTDRRRGRSQKHRLILRERQMTRAL